MRLRLLLGVLMLFIVSACGRNESNSPETKQDENAASAQPAMVEATRVNESGNSYMVLDKPMHIPGLERQRTIRLYLPPNYSKKHEGYPVLYMHDAQNLFDEATSYAGEWQVDETLNKLAEHHELEIIVVGIDNGEEKRITELSAWDHPEYGEGEGRQYTDFIVQHLKPFIDANYNTNSKDTAMMGSSLGGLSSHYAIYQYPNVFSRAGIFSPSYWYNEEVFSFTQDNPIPSTHRLFFTVGEQEGEGMTQPMQRMVTLIKDSGHPEANIYSEVDPQGNHNEAFWARRLEDALLWLYGMK